MNKEMVKEFLNAIYGCNGKQDSGSIKLYINSIYGWNKKGIDLND